MLEVSGFTREINDKLTIELNASLTGWSVETHTLTDFGGRAVNQVFWSESEEEAKAFCYGMIAGACAVINMMQEEV